MQRLANKTLALAAFLIGLGLLLHAQPYIKVAAKVGNDIITTYDIDEALELAASEMTEAEKESPEGRKKLEEMRGQVLDRMIQEKLVVQAALRPAEDAQGKDGKENKAAAARPNPYLPGDEELEEAVSRALDEARAGYSSTHDFLAELERQHITESAFKARLRERVRERLIFQRMVMAKRKEMQGTFNVTALEAERYFQDHKSQFVTGRQALLRHIVSDSEAASKKLLARIKAGEDFEALAKAESKDPGTRDKGGFLGWIEKGQLEWPTLDEAAFSAKQGQVVGPVKTARGWHVLRVEGLKDAEQKTFQEVKDKVMQAIYMKRLNERIESWVKDLKQKTYVETMP